jgi:methylated-DNA-[protein]-cysteine S-methyltransferase
MAAAAFALFPTAVGSCGIAWRDETIVATHLPEGNDAATASRLASRAGGAGLAEPPPAIAAVVEAITRLVAGERIDLGFVACDLGAVGAFEAEVYRLCRAIPPGETRTYGDIATAMGDRLLAQAVGRALGRNPIPIIVPCHRVMGAGGRLTGFSATGGVATKLRLLAIEGARIGAAPTLFDDLPLAVRPQRKGGA